jgi:hypothetical protein
LWKPHDDGQLAEWQLQSKSWGMMQIICNSCLKQQKQRNQHPETPSCNFQNREVKGNTSWCLQNFKKAMRWESGWGWCCEQQNFGLGLGVEIRLFSMSCDLRTWNIHYMG